MEVVNVATPLQNVPLDVGIILRPALSAVRLAESAVVTANVALVVARERNGTSVESVLKIQTV